MLPSLNHFINKNLLWVYKKKNKNVKVSPVHPLIFPEPLVGVLNSIENTGTVCGIMIFNKCVGHFSYSAHNHSNFPYLYV